jgi:hypothetical protein
MCRLLKAFAFYSIALSRVAAALLQYTTVECITDLYSRGCLVIHSSILAK